MKITNINFTNGAGNNIFQYAFAKMFSESKKTELSHPALPVLSIKENKIPFPDNSKVLTITGSSKNPVNYHSLLTGMEAPNHYNLKVYPEDFTLYTPRIKYFRDYFSPFYHGVNDTDLVMHLRLGDRLIMKSTYQPENHIEFPEFDTAIQSFDFERLHIVTDMPVWRRITVPELSKMVFHRQVKPEDRINLEQAVSYFNSLYEGFSSYSPLVRAGYSVEDDFDYMRSFKNILFQHGTLAWWAAALGCAEQVAVYSKWRGGKNINLAWADLPGWRHWGPATAPSHDVKEYHLRKLATENNLQTFVETGTRGGTALRALHPYFRELHSVEIIEPAYQKVQRKLKSILKIQLYLGDSAEVLPGILDKISGPTLFWLDAHDGRNSTPIIKELEHVLGRQGIEGIIVIDDARYFGTEDAYPKKETIYQMVDMMRPGSKVDEKFDSIRIWL